jgi:hypothetical protein
MEQLQDECVFFIRYFQYNQTEYDEMGGARSKAGREKTNKYRILAGNPEGKCKFKRFRSRREVNNRVGSKDIARQDLNRIRLAQDRVQPCVHGN